MNNRLVTLIVPVLNEEDSIPLFYDAVLKIRTAIIRDKKESTLKNLHKPEASVNNIVDAGVNPDKNLMQCVDIAILFIDDGSTDGTLECLKRLKQKDRLVSYLAFTRNFGKEAALIAGIEHAKGDAVIPIDVDLQDPPDVVPKLIERYLDGADVVLAKRVDRGTDSMLKRKTAQWFYSLHNLISKPTIEENVGDFRLMSREIVENIKRLPEKNLFMKGLFAWPGANKMAIVEYKRTPRAAGSTKFNAWKLWNFALEGITSFSTAPLKFSTYFGALVSIFSFAMAVYYFFQKVIVGNPISGYASIIVSIFFLAGVQLISIGVLGEYVGRIYIEVKNRPRYILKGTSEKKEDFNNK